MKHLNKTITPSNVEESALQLIVALIMKQQSTGDFVQQIAANDSNLLFSGLTPPDFCRQLNGVNTQQVNAFLVDNNLLMKADRGHKVSSHARDKYFSEKCNKSKDGVPYYYPVLTLKGAEYLCKAYREKRLPMKKKWDGIFTDIELLKIMES